MTGRMTQTYFQPGVPWVAFVMLLAWCVVEATVFTYTMLPTVSGALSELAGGVEPPRITIGVLFAFLLLLVAGSFACLQSLVTHVRKREYKFLAQMVVIEILVMFFETMFLYRQFIDTLTPWVAQETGVVLGFRATCRWPPRLARHPGHDVVPVRPLRHRAAAGPHCPPAAGRRAKLPELGAERAGAGAGGVVARRARRLQAELEWLHAKGEQLARVPGPAGASAGRGRR